MNKAEEGGQAVNFTASRLLELTLTGLLHIPICKLTRFPSGRRPPVVSKYRFRSPLPHALGRCTKNLQPITNRERRGSGFDAAAPLFIMLRTRAGSVKRPSLDHRRLQRQSFMGVHLICLECSNSSLARSKSFVVTAFRSH